MSEVQENFKIDAMRAMGWNIEVDIPMASAENLQILKEMEEMTQLKLQLNEQIKSYDEREKAIQRHKRNIEAALNQNLTLYNTIKNDVMKENHLYKLAHLERCKINEDLRNNQKEYTEIVEHKGRIENKICISKSEIDDLTNRIKSAKTALMEWTEAMEDGNKGYQLIERYYKDDQQSARELNTRRQNLQSEIDRRRQAVVQMYDEQNTLEKNLERTASLYRSAHLERRQMVNTWKTAVNQMTQRETDIQDGETLYVDLEETAQSKADEYHHFDERLNDIINNNRQVEATIEELNTDTSYIKGQIQHLIDLCYLKQRETESLQKELANLSNRVELQRTENRLHQREKVDKETELWSFDELLDKVEKRKVDIRNKNLSANQRLQILDEMNDNEQKVTNDLAKESERINGLLFRTLQKTSEVSDKEKLLTVNNNALLSTLSSVQRNQKNVEKEVQRQTEIHYNLSFKYLECEKRLNHLRGFTIDPEIEARNQRILAELDQNYAKLQRRMQVTEAQNKRLNYSMNTMVSAFNNDNKDLVDVKFKIKEAQVFCEGTIKRLKERQINNQELIVELNLVKMRCNDIEIEIEKCEKGTFNLEQHRLQLQRSVKDRQIELKSQEEVLLLKRKHLTEELSTLRADLGERKKHIEAMRARFELTSKLLGTNEDGTVVTTTQLKVERAQDKQLLADEGDELNKKVLKAEQEVVALENTLRQFDKSNDNYRKTFRKDGDVVADKSTEDLKELQLDYCKKLNELKMLRCKVQHSEHQLEKVRKVLESVEKELVLARENHEENSLTYEKLMNDLDEQNAKIIRADRETKILQNQLKKRLSITDDYLEKFNFDQDLQQLEERNMRAFNRLVDMAMSYSNGNAIILKLNNKGLPMPFHLKKTQSSISWNSGSSLDRNRSISVKDKSSSYGLCRALNATNDDKDDHTSSSFSVVSLNFSEG